MDGRGADAASSSVGGGVVSALGAAAAADGAGLTTHATVARVTARLNERNRASKHAQKECSDLYLNLFLQRTPRVEAVCVTLIVPDTTLGTRIVAGEGGWRIMSLSRLKVPFHH